MYLLTAKYIKNYIGQHKKQLIVVKQVMEIKISVYGFSWKVQVYEVAVNMCILEKYEF